MRYSLILLSYRREKNLRSVVERIRQQDPAPAEIIVWHNAPSSIVVPGVTNIHASKNYGCSVRHEAALLADTPGSVFLDDDVLLARTDCVARLLAPLDEGTAAVTGVIGRDLHQGGCWYSKGAERTGACPIDVAKGWFHATTTPAILACIERSSKNPPETRGEDDICLSAASSLVLGLSPRLVPFATGAFKVLRDQIGQQNRPDHQDRRDEACRVWLASGWRPQSWEQSWKK